MQSGNVKIVGIVGMDGSGKTTLAKELYYRKRSAFDRCSFLSGVRDASAKNELQRLQRQLLKDLACIDCEINSTSEGKGIIRARLNYTEILLVLDDIDHEDQLDAFIARDVLIRSDSSLIIVTTRDKGMLRRSEITMMYEVKGLDAKQARELLCWHAFLQSLPLIGFEGLVEEFLSVANGLPLSLKVFGGHVYGNHDTDYWEAELKKISRILPNDIISRLKISYDALEEEEKQMFLDIACFLVGHDKNKGIRIWDGSGWSGSHGLQTLEYKCLVEIDEENCLKMHDHLRDLGRNIANSYVDPCRLWCSEKGTKFLKGQMEIKHVRGVVARGHQGEPSKWYGRIPLLGTRLNNPIDSGVGLKLLDVRSDHRVKGKLSQDLLWLRWSDCSHRSIRRLSLKNLRVLELDGVNTQKLWHDPQAPLQLRELKIVMKYECKPAKFPRSIQLLKHLEKIVLHDWTGNSLPEEVCDLESLRHLDLKRCLKLRSLPKRFDDLTNLQYLRLENCYALVISQSFNQLTQLQYLHLSYCKWIQPAILGIKVTTLEELSLKSHTQMSFESLMEVSIMQEPRMLDYFMQESLMQEPRMLHYFMQEPRMQESFMREHRMPKHRMQMQKYLMQKSRMQVARMQEFLVKITRQASLRKLDLVTNAYVKQMPNEFWSLTNFQVLKIRSYSLVSLPPSLGNLLRLTHLRLESCKELKCLPESLGQLKQLTHLQLESCKKLKCLPESLGQLKELTHLIISESRIEYLPKRLGELTNLQYLAVDDCPITHLRFEGLNIKPTMFYLQNISLRRSKLQILSISGDDCPNLKTLTLSNNECLEEVETLPPSLVKLNLRGCIILKRISGTFSLSKLQELDISGCRELKELPSVVHLISLGKLEAMNCWKLQRIEGLEHLQRLKYLHISADNAIIWNWMRTQRLPSISTINLRGRSTRGNGVRVVESILNSFSFSLDVLKFSASASSYGEYKNFLRFQAPVWSPVIVCSVIECGGILFGWDYPPFLIGYLGRPFDETTEHGEWIHISIIRHGSHLRKVFTAKDTIHGLRRGSKKNGIKKGWIVMLSNGEEWRIEEVLFQWLNFMLP